MGVNQGHEAVRTAQALIDLALLTGNIGRPETGANSITGQCNAMGSRLFSNTTCLLGGHEFENPEHRAKVAGILGIDEARIPAQEPRLRPDPRRDPGRPDPRALGDRHERRPLVDPPERGARDAPKARRAGRAGSVRDDRDRPARRHRPAGRRVGREGRHLHQLRAPDRAPPEGAPRARLGAGRLLDPPPRRRGVGMR